MRSSRVGDNRLWQPMVVVAILFLVVSAIISRHIGVDLPARSLFALRIESPKRAVVEAYYQDDEWQGAGRDVIYAADTTLRLTPGEEIIYRGSIVELGDVSYIRLREEGVLERRLNGESFSSKINSALYNRLRGAGVSSDSESVVATMLLSRDDQLSKGMRQMYRQGGAAHILVVSGLHVVIIAMIVSALLSPLTLMFRGNVLRIILTVCCLWLFASINFWSASVERAVIMYTLFMASRLLFRHHNTLTTLATTVVIMLIIDPLSLYDISFQLSSLAVLAISVWVLPLWSRRPIMLRGWWCDYLVLPILMSVGCLVATMPIVLYNFGYHSFAGVVIAPLLYFTSGAILLLSIATLVAPIFVFSQPLEWVTQLQNCAVGWTASLSSGDELPLTLPSAVAIYALYLAATIYLTSGGENIAEDHESEYRDDSEEE